MASASIRFRLGANASLAAAVVSDRAAVYCECERRNYSLTLSFVSALLSVYISFVVDYDIYSVVTLLIVFNRQQQLLGAVFFSFLNNVLNLNSWTILSTGFKTFYLSTMSY